MKTSAPTFLRRPVSLGWGYRWLGAVVMLVGCAAAQGRQLPDGFAIETVASGLNEPVAIEQAPDGRWFVAEKGGAVRVIRDGVAVDPPFARLDVFAEDESGLLGLALGPSFANTGHVYLFATATFDEQQIIRYTVVGDTGTLPTVIRDHLPTSGTFHNGGCLRVGPDRHLYFSIGDNGRSDNGQDMRTLAGKLCRINLDGTTPSTNPFVTPTGSHRAIYALGFRNPFRFCFAPDGSVFVADVGSSGDARFEEINHVRAGENCGWPTVEGMAFADAGEFRTPLLAYHDEGSAITGLVYYDAEQYPASYRGNLFHLDFVSQHLFRVVLEGDAVSRHEVFADLDGGPIDLAIGNDGSLYYTELFSGSIKRIRYTLAQSTGGAGEGEPADNSGSPDAPDEPPDATPISTPLTPLCGNGMLLMLMFAPLLGLLLRQLNWT